MNLTVDQRTAANLRAMLGDKDFQIALLAAQLDDANAKIAELEKIIAALKSVAACDNVTQPVRQAP